MPQQKPKTGKLSEKERQELAALMIGERDVVTYDEVVYPALRIAQADSDICVEASPDYIEGMKPGDIYNALTKARYQRPLRFSVLRFFGTSFIEFHPKNKRQIIDPDVPPGDPRTLWTENEDGERVAPKATRFLNYAFFLHDHASHSPILWSAASSRAIRQARETNGACQYPIEDPETGIVVTSPAPYARMFHMLTKSRPKDNKILFDPVIVPAGFVMNAEVLKMCKSILSRANQIEAQRKEALRKGRLKLIGDDVVDTETGEIVTGEATEPPAPEREPGDEQSID